MISSAAEALRTKEASHMRNFVNRTIIGAQGRRLEAVAGLRRKRANPQVRRREAMRRLAEAAGWSACPIVRFA